MIGIKNIEYGNKEVIPWYYGFSYQSFNTNTEVWVIIPINLLFKLYKWMRYNRTDVDKYAKEIYENGRNDGRKFEKKRIKRKENV